MYTTEFQCLVDDCICDLAPFGRHIIKGSVEAGVAVLAFPASELDTVRTLFKENVRDGFAGYLNHVQLVGADGYLYILTPTSLEKKEKMPHSIMKAYRYYLRYKKKQRRADRYIANELQKRDGLHKLHGGSFASYTFSDKENNMAFPFRLHTSKSENKPLFVLFHGAGALGHDNKKQHVENLILYKRILPYDCNILVPQAPFGANRGDGLIRQYLRSVKNLIDILPCDFDRNRIYIVGTSFGGFCVWHSAYLYPDFFAAAVPVMGGLFFDHNYDAYDLERLTKTPLWVAHASDDANVKVDSDDYCVEHLQNMGADVTYSRPDKGGHSIANKFYATENWVQWCLDRENLKK